MKCDTVDLVALMKGELGDAERREAEVHLKTCRNCAQEMRQLDGVIRAFRRVEPVNPSEGFAWRVRQAFVAAHPEFIESQQRVPGEELGFWAGLRRQFAFVPAWALSVSVHIMVLAIAAILLFSKYEPEEERDKLPFGHLRPKRESNIDAQYHLDPLREYPRDGGAPGVRLYVNPDTDEPFLSPDHPDRDGGQPDRNIAFPRRRPFDPNVYKELPPLVKVDDSSFAVQFEAWRLEAAMRDERYRNAGIAEGGKSVARALAWLAARQQDDGSWNAPSFVRETGERDQHQVGVTGLVLMAFVGEGHTRGKGEYVETVDKAVRFLLSLQGENGLIGRDDANVMYDHAIASIALLECMVLDGDEDLRPHVTGAVDYVIRAQNADGGWGYRPDASDCDTSVMGWQILLLRLNRELVGGTPISSLTMARKALEKMTDSETGKTGYRSRGHYPHQPYGTTAVGMFAWLLSSPVTDDRLQDLQARVLISDAQPKVFEGVQGGMVNDLYFWFFGTLSMGQREGEPWKTWCLRLMKPLMRMQEDSGAWPEGFDRWSGYGGSVYTTAMGALILQACHRYPALAR